MASCERTRVMIVDDHSIMRFGLKQILEQSGEFEVVGQAANGEEAVTMAAGLSPYVIVMDVIMPKMDGVQACREIMVADPNTRVVMLTASTDVDAAVEALASGASAYLQKETDRERLLSTIRDVVQGELRAPAAAARKVIERMRTPAEPIDVAQDAGLTSREREILVAFASGMSYADIAESRGIKPVTVRNAVYGIQDKLSVKSMQGLVLWAVRNGLLDDYAAGEH